MTDSIPELHQWLRGQLGRALIQAEAQLLATTFDDVFGQELLQLGTWGVGRELLAPALTQARAMRAPMGVDDVLSLRGHCPASIGTNLDLTVAAWVLQNPTAYQTALMH